MNLFFFYWKEINVLNYIKQFETICFPLMAILSA